MIVVEIQIDLPSLANLNLHWSKKAKIRKAQKELVKLYLSPHESELQKFSHVRLVRISPRMLDPDNLVSAFKNLVDAICEIKHPNLAPGRADGFGDIKFEYGQEQGKPQRVRIEIT